jgi:hypothetical protein
MSNVNRPRRRGRLSAQQRRRRVRRIRAAIRAGAYENDLKLTIALDRLLSTGPRAK